MGVRGVGEVRRRVTGSEETQWSRVPSCRQSIDSSDKLQVASPITLLPAPAWTTVGTCTAVPSSSVAGSTAA